MNAGRLADLVGPMNPRLILVSLVFFMVGAAAALVVLSDRLAQPAPRFIKVEGKAAIGGDFALTDHTGKRVTQAEFAGSHMLVFFGFTSCPDICPTALQTMAQAIDLLGERGERVVPVFVTIDPERDTVERVADYVGQFHGRMAGLTGTRQEIQAVAKAYRVYFEKVGDESSSDDYAMDHTSVIYLMDGNGEYAAHFSFNAGAEEIARRTGEILRRKPGSPGPSS
jgi:cytochrome oxidase Cu insertion factor (SCO1/SenC/PrrC family)